MLQIEGDIMLSVLPDIEIMSISQVRPNPSNPRLIRDGRFLKLWESIENFPEMLYIRPIVIDIHNTIIGGNQRYHICREMNFKEIPVIRAINLSENQYKQFTIRDNVSSGEWDFEKLLDEWDREFLEHCSFDMKLLKRKALELDQVSDTGDFCTCPNCGFHWRKV